MKFLTPLILLLLLISTSVKAQTTVFSALLITYVDSNGNVDYKGLRKSSDILDVYLNDLNKTIPTEEWSSNKAKSFWINVYNAYIIKLILKTYPLKKITDIKIEGKNAWKIPFVKVGGHLYSLDYVEHKILRRWHNDPRIHVGLNATSVSGPRFINFVFTEANVDAKLEELMSKFINDETKNKITATKVEVSKIFDWYKEDFTHNISLIDYLNKYSKVRIDNTAEIVYSKYDWSLNDKN